MRNSLMILIVLVSLVSIAGIAYASVYEKKGSVSEVWPQQSASCSWANDAAREKIEYACPSGVEMIDYYFEGCHCTYLSRNSSENGWNTGAWKCTVNYTAICNVD